MRRLFFLLLVFFNLCYVQSQTNNELLSLPSLKGPKSLAASLRLKTDLKPYAADYLYSYEQDTYNKFANDEFEFNSKLKIAVQQLQNHIDAIKTDSLYVCFTYADFGEYDFDRNCFSFEPLKSSTRFTAKDFPYCDKCKIQTEITYGFMNAEKFNNMYINPEDANRLIKSRKDSYGDINRNVGLLIVYKLLDKIDEKIENQDRRVVDLFGSIKYIMVIDYDKFERGNMRQIYKMTEDK